MYIVLVACWKITPPPPPPLQISVCTVVNNVSSLSLQFMSFMELKRSAILRVCELRVCELRVCELRVCEFASLRWGFIASKTLT